MIKINLLLKKKAKGTTIPGLDSILEKIGLKNLDLAAMRGVGIRVVVLAVGLYIGNFVPNYLYEEEMAEKEIQLQELNTTRAGLQKQLDAKKDIRKKMEELVRQETEAKRRLDLIQQITRDRATAFRTVENLSLMIPNKVWLNKIDYATKLMTLDGTSWEYPAINDFLKALNESSAFSAMTLRNITTEGLQDKPQPGISVMLQRPKNFSVEVLLKGQG